METAVIFEIEERAGWVGGVKSIVVGTNDAASGRVVEETAVGVIIVSNQNGFDCLCCVGIGSVGGVDTFDIGGGEERNEFTVVGFDAVHFKVWSGFGSVFTFNGKVVGELDGVAYAVVPEFGWEKIFRHVVAGNIANVFPIGFGEAVFVLSIGCGAGDVGTSLELVLDVITDEFEVTISNHGGGISAKVNNELREGKGDGMVMHVLEGIYVFVARFAVD